MALVLLLGYIYTFRPVRLKDHVLSSLLIGLGASFAFLYGFITPFMAVSSFYIGLVPIEGSIQATITQESLLISFFAFIGLVIGSMITDIDGFERG